MMTLSLLKRLSLVLFLSAGLFVTACDDDDDDNGGGGGGNNSISATIDGENVSIGNASVQVNSGLLSVNVANSSSSMTVAFPDTLSAGVYDSSNTDLSTVIQFTYVPDISNPGNQISGQVSSSGLSVDLTENSAERVEGTFSGEIDGTTIEDGQFNADR